MEISVIVVCYNQQDTIGRAIESVLAQDIDVPYEIVVSDDCSTDGTADVARRYAEQYPDKVRLHVNERNLGVQRNYFDAMKRCRAELIADCAGDDTWSDPTKLRREYEVMCARPEVSMVHTGWSYRYPDGRVVKADVPALQGMSAIEDGDKYLREHIIYTNTVLVHLCTALYRKSPVLKALEEDPEFFLNPEYGCEDYQIVCAEATAGRIAYIPESTLHYTVDGDSITSRRNSIERQFRFYRGTLKLRRRAAEKYGIAESEMQPYYDRMVYFLVSLARLNRDRKIAREMVSWFAAEGFRIPFKARLKLIMMRIW